MKDGKSDGKSSGEKQPTRMAGNSRGPVIRPGAGEKKETRENRPPRPWTALGSPQAKELAALIDEVVKDARTQYGITREQICGGCYLPVHILDRIRTLKRLSTPGDVEQVFTGLASAFNLPRGRQPYQEQAERARELAEKVWELPRTPAKQFDTLIEKYDALAAEKKGIEDRVTELDTEVRSLHEQLAQLTGSSASPDGARLAQVTPDTLQQIRDLRVRLVEAQADLDTALKQQADNRAALQECADQLNNVLGDIVQYFDHVLGGGPGA